MAFFYNQLLRNGRKQLSQTNGISLLGCFRRFSGVPQTNDAEYNNNEVQTDINQLNQNGDKEKNGNSIQQLFEVMKKVEVNLNDEKQREIQNQILLAIQQFDKQDLKNFVISFKQLNLNQTQIKFVDDILSNKILRLIPQFNFQDFEQLIRNYYLFFGDNLSKKQRNIITYLFENIIKNNLVRDKDNFEVALYLIYQFRDIFTEQIILKIVEDICKTQEISNLLINDIINQLNLFSKLNIVVSSYFDQLIQIILQQNYISENQLAEIFQNFAKLQYFQFTKYIKQLLYSHLIDINSEQKISEQLQKYQENNLSIILKSLATFKYNEENKADILRISRELLRNFKIYADEQNLETLNAQHVVDVAYAFARSNLYRRFEFKQIQFFAKMVSERLTKYQVRTLLWSFSKMRHYDEKTYKALTRNVFKQIKQFTLQELSDVLQSLAAVLHENHNLFQEVINITKSVDFEQYDIPLHDLFNEDTKVTEQNNQFKTINLFSQNQNQILKTRCKLMWSMMVMEMWDPEWWENAIENISNVSLVSVPAESQTQLFQCFMMCDVRGFEYFDTREIPDFFADKCTNLWLQARFQEPLPSRFQREVFLTLEKLGYSAQLEQLTQDGLVNIDIALEINQQLVAVVVDGPQHYTVSQPYRQLASGEIRNRLLVAKGWRVVRVPFYEWERRDEGGNIDWGKREEYLKQIMKEVSQQLQQQLQLAA
eukprot:TRINITY_DN8202_c0_g1_i1.p1 TRINITY_DN8202_c0_g1~~TRINITY_DN8202_c0_g1_i1.p1  ORF type:complete len:745 (+),score=74.07 TRINITY_DN8202_c0_g1_i1:103-2235(+)